MRAFFVLFFGASVCFTGTTSVCRDHNGYCKSWAWRGECYRNPGYMHVYCRLSCKLCRRQIDGRWSSWTAYGRCSRSCGGGIKSRQRSCNNPRPANGGRQCYGSSRESIRCNRQPCPVNGGVRPWAAFGRCTKSCGTGIQIRERKCDNPAPAHGGKSCTEPLKEIRTCNMHPCPVDGQYGPWRAYGECSVSCGGGVKYRTRLCNNPAPRYGGKLCQGPSTEQMRCHTHTCQVDGQFGPWTPYGACSVTCGLGVRIRERKCDNPAPSNGGNPCEGSNIDRRPCIGSPCPVDGGYSVWSKFGECSVSCGGGQKYRQRICNNPKPAYGGKDCTGDPIDGARCNTHKCPVDGGYGPWTLYGACSKSCGGGIKTRTRKCNFPEPSGGGKPCQGPSREDATCNTHACPVDGGYSPWTPYGTCSKTCGGGQKSRERKCNFPEPSGGGKPCQGPSRENTTCNTHACQVDGGYSPWTPYQKCSKSCGGGLKFRERTCDFPKPSGGGKPCQGPSRENKTCNTHACPVDGGYSSWSQYGDCTKPCGGGKKYRNRDCNNPKPAKGGKPCQGPSVESATCNTQQCPINLRECTDKNEKCSAIISRCNDTLFRHYMAEQCRKSCKLCTVSAPAARINEKNCGIRKRKVAKLQISARVVGGITAEKSSWPWHATIKFMEGTRLLCGGSLINSQWILTAAHCFGDKTVAEKTRTEKLLVVLNEHRIKENEGDELIMTVSKMIRHTDFVGKVNASYFNYNHDIALLKLSNPVPNDFPVAPICLPDPQKDEIQQKTCSITGHGRISMSSYADILKEAKVPIANRSDCESFIIKAAPKVPFNNMICAGSKEARIDSCEGDSGGPLVCPTAESRLEQTGIVSWGPKFCALKDSYGVYTKVSNYISWIKRQIRE